jgi:hypothetical protein
VKPLEGPNSGNDDEKEEEKREIDEAKDDVKNAGKWKFSYKKINVIIQ